MVATVAIVGNKTASLNTPAGWAMLGAGLNNGTGETLVNYGRRYVAGDGNPVITWTTSNRYLAVINTFLGVDATTALDAAVPTYSTGSSVSSTSPSLTTVTTGALRIFCSAKGATGAHTVQFPMTKVSDSTTTALGFCVAYELDLGAGNTGTRTATIGSTTWVASTIILRPATPNVAGRLQGKETIITAGATTATVTLPQNGTNGSTLFCMAGTYTAGTVGNKINAVDYNSGTNFTLSQEGFGPSNNNFISLWYYANNTQTTPPVVVARRGGGSDDITMWVSEWIGLDNASLTDTGATANGTGTTASVTVPTMSAGDKLVINAVVADLGGAFTPDTDYSRDFFYSNSADVSIGVQHRIMAGGSGDTITFAVTSGTWASVAADYDISTGGITGALSQTLGALTSTGTGTVAIVGTLSTTLGALTSSAAGTVAIVGTLTKTLDALTLSAAGTVGTPGITGTLSQTLGTLTSTSTGTVAVAGALTQTLGTLTGSVTGTVAVTGTLTGTLGTLTGTSAGTVAVTAALSQALGALTSTASGTVRVAGTLTATLGALSSAGTGTVRVVGALSQTLGALTLTGTGVVGSVPITGTLSATLGTLTGASTGTVRVAGTGSVTLDAVTSSAQGTVLVRGTLSVTLGVLSASSQGVVEVRGALSVTLSTLSLVAEGTVTGTPIVSIPGTATPSDYALYTATATEARVYTATAQDSALYTAAPSTGALFSAQASDQALATAQIEDGVAV